MTYFRVILYGGLLLSSLSAKAQQTPVDEGRSQLLGPWKLRSEATKMRWVQAGYFPRANDLFPITDFSADSIAANSALGELDWDFECRFQPQKTYKHYRLHTGYYANYDMIRMNGYNILCNQHIYEGLAGYSGYAVDLPAGMCRDSINVLRIKHLNPLEDARKKREEDPLRCVIRDNDSSGLSAIIRKPPVEFGWDIAPRRLTAGLEQGIYLHGWNQLRLDQFAVYTVFANRDSAKIRIKIILFSDTKTTANIVLSGTETMSENHPNLLVNPGENTFEFYQVISKPHLWWPNGCYQQAGDQKPYLAGMKASITSAEDQIDANTNYGIRDIKLVQEDDKFGESFYFKINGKSVFVKGVNMVPTRGMQPWEEYQSYWQSGLGLGRVAEAGVNMLRIWGGGGYEEDWFYKQCDSLGLMVWQDFMYAGMMYLPDASNAIEAVQQTRRLAKHPCMALFCGNNEIGVAWKNWGWQKKYNIHGADSVRLRKAYRNLFRGSLGWTVYREYPEANYCITSPQSNWGKAADFLSGDNHYWGIWHGEFPVDSLMTQIPRFASEWGLPSYPLSGFDEAGRSEVSKEGLKELDSRLQSYKTASLMHRYTRQLHLSELVFDTRDSAIRNWLLKYKSDGAFSANQSSQSIAMHFGIAAHRLAMPFCMGTMWWQYNDIWPGTTWSILDISSAPKSAWYEMKRMYANLIAVAIPDKSKLNLRYVNDGWGDSSISIRVYDFYKPKKVLMQQVVVAKASSTGSLVSIPFSKLNLWSQSIYQPAIVELTCNGRLLYRYRYYRILDQHNVNKEP